MTGLVEAKISFRRDWAPGLITLGLDARIEDFRPGQFLNLGLELGGELVRRAYSLASAPGAQPERDEGDGHLAHVHAILQWYMEISNG